MAIPRSAEAAALLRLELLRLPAEGQTELQRLRMTALEMAIPLAALWMFLPESVRPAAPAPRQVIQHRRCPAARLRIRSRRARRASQRALAHRIPPRGF
jgi:hypothetical protein